MIKWYTKNDTSKCNSRSLSRINSHNDLNLCHLTSSSCQLVCQLVCIQKTFCNVQSVVTCVCVCLWTVCFNSPASQEEDIRPQRSRVRLWYGGRRRPPQERRWPSTGPLPDPLQLHSDLQARPAAPLPADQLPSHQRGKGAQGETAAGRLQPVLRRSPELLPLRVRLRFRRGCGDGRGRVEAGTGKLPPRGETNPQHENRRQCPQIERLYTGSAPLIFTMATAWDVFSVWSSDRGPAVEWPHAPGRLHPQQGARRRVLLGSRRDREGPGKTQPAAPHTLPRVQAGRLRVLPQPQGQSEGRSAGEKRPAQKHNTTTHWHSLCHVVAKRRYTGLIKSFSHWWWLINNDNHCALVSVVCPCRF